MNREVKAMECNICRRLHSPSQACPLRLASAYMMLPQALERLTVQDKRWMALHPEFSVLDTIENAIADIL